MKIVQILFFLALAFVACRAQFDSELTEEEAAAKWNCASHIVCDLFEGHVLGRLIPEAGPKLVEEGLRWITEAYDMEMIDTSKESIKKFFEDYSKNVCVRKKEEREEAVKMFLIKFSKYYDRVCQKNPDPVECEGCNKAMKKYEEIISEYIEKGECHNPKDDSEDFAEKGKDKFPMPS